MSAKQLKTKAHVRRSKNQHSGLRLSYVIQDTSVLPAV